MKQALVVVPKGGLSVNQYERTRRLLEREGFRVQVASSTRDEIEQLDFRLRPDLGLSQVEGGDYDVVVFVAGHGNRELWDSEDAHRVARDALAAGRVVAASGAAVAILARAGVLRGRKATGPVSLAATLEEEGAQYTAEPVQAEDGIVTLRRSEAFESFGKQIVEQHRQRVRREEAA